MTTEEKLQHFLDFCMEDARTRSAKMYDDYTAALEKTFEEHKVDAKRRADMQLQIESEKIEREINKKLSIEQINIKRELGHKQEELKEKLFVEVKDILANFLESPEYDHLLNRQIQEAEDLAGNDEMLIYLDPADESKQRRISLHNHNTNIKISQYSFTGGTRAVIPSKNILIDNSFQTKLEEAKRDFRFDLDFTGGNTNG